MTDVRETAPVVAPLTTPLQVNDNNIEDDDDVTVIVLDPALAASGTYPQIDWQRQSVLPPELEARRRTILLREIRRLQRSSFIHFVILCMIPTILLLAVLVTVFSDADSDACVVSAADSGFTCTLEARSFLNAFTTRCICESVATAREP